MDCKSEYMGFEFPRLLKNIVLYYYIHHFRINNYSIIVDKIYSLFFILFIYVYKTVSYMYNIVSRDKYVYISNININ